MRNMRNCGIEEIVVTRHAAGRWNQRINPGEHTTPDEISLLLTVYLAGERFQQIGPQGYGIFCADNEIILCGTAEQGRLIVETFIGRKSASPALLWNPAGMITWHKKQRRREMAAYTRAG